MNCKHDWIWVVKRIDGVDCYSHLKCVDCESQIHMDDIENLVNIVGTRANQFITITK